MTVDVAMIYFIRYQNTATIPKTDESEIPNFKILA